jgi:hypothetical protein
VHKPHSKVPPAKHTACQHEQKHLEQQSATTDIYKAKSLLQVFLQAMSSKPTIETSSFMQLPTVHISIIELTLNHITARQQTKANALPGTRLTSIIA